MADDWLTVRIRLADSAAFNAQMAEAGIGVKAFGDEVEATGDKSAFAAEKTFLFGEEMYSLRRYAFYGITALGLTGAAVVKLGWDFDEAKTSGIGALTGITGSATEARREVNQLVNITHDNGLTLGALVPATKNMLTFGYSVKETNSYLKDFSDFAAATGQGSSGLNSIVSIADRVKDTGRLTSLQLKSLGNLGVPSSQLGAAFGLSPQVLTEAQMGQVALGPSSISTLAAWMQQYAAKQPKSLGENVGIFKSYFSQGLGMLTQPLFGWVDQAMDGLNVKMKSIIAAGKTGGFGGMLGALDPSLTLLHGWQTLAGAIKIVWATLQNLWVVIRPVVGGLLLLTSAILSVTSHSTALKLILEPLIALYIISRGQLLLFWLAQKAVALILGILRGAIFLYRLALIAWTIATKAATGAQWLLNIALDANPVVWIVIGIIALTAALVLLGLVIYRFRGDFVDAFNWITHNWRLLAEILAAPFTLGLSVILTHISAIKTAISATFDWIISKAKAVFGWMQSLYNKIPGHSLISGTLNFGLGALGTVPGLAAGGTVTRPGWTIVGENGPELRYQGVGATVVPLQAASGGIGSLVKLFLEIAPQPILLNGEKIAEATFDYKATVQALS